MIRASLRAVAPALAVALVLHSPIPASAAPVIPAAPSSDMLRAWKTITGAAIAKHVAILASDDYEGREPGTAGEAKAIRYFEQEFRAAGAAPGLGGGYLQPVPLIELRRTGTPAFSVAGGAQHPGFAFKTDFIAAAGRPGPGATLAGLPIVFAGHGVTAPEYEWDDYAGATVAGGAVILLRGEPDSPDDSTLFRGKALTAHGVGATQYQNAARHGARAAIVIHTDASTGFPWATVANSVGTAQNFLADAPDVPRLEMVVHVSEPAARRLLGAAGLDLDSLTARANRRGFRSVKTALNASMAFTANTRAFTSHNVVAKIPGAGAPEECVIYTGHWDHLGRNDSLPGDKIFNGAVDNATGSASLIELARAWASLPVRPRRTVYFVATTAEEKGLLGSEYLASHPIVPLAKTAAVLNLDALFPFGAYSAMTVTGLGSSEIEDIAAAAGARIGRILQDDGSPQLGAYYRSDHYPFAKRGVPAFFGVGNPRPEEMTESNPATKRFNDYITSGYHKVTDQYDAATWDMAGIEGDVRMYFEIGWRIADTARFPNWRYENEFRALRDAMMSTRESPGASARR